MGHVHGFKGQLHSHRCGGDVVEYLWCWRFNYCKKLSMDVESKATIRGCTERWCGWRGRRGRASVHYSWAVLYATGILHRGSISMWAREQKTPCWWEDREVTPFSAAVEMGDGPVSCCREPALSSLRWLTVDFPYTPDNPIPRCKLQRNENSYLNRYCG